MMPRIKVLISAYACEPNRGSEPGVGWNLAKELAKHNEVHVLTRENNRDIIDRHRDELIGLDIEFHYIDLPLIAMKVKKVNPLFGYLYYLFWQIKAFFVAKKIIKMRDIQLIHHLTFGNIWMPMFMGLLNIPLVIGPLGGGETIPTAFRRDFSTSGRIKEYLRDLITLTLPYNPFLLYNCHQAKAIILKTTASADRVPNRYRNKCSLMTDVGINSDSIGLRMADANNQYLLNVGRFESWRGQALLLHSFALALEKNRKLRLIMIGDGPDANILKSICKQAGMEDNIQFAGQVSMEHYYHCLEESTIVVNTTLKEGGVTFFFDALAYGKPVINLNVPGCAQINKQINGYCLDIINPEQVKHGIAEAILALSSNATLRGEISQRALNKIKESCTWTAKGQLINAIYKKLLTP